MLFMQESQALGQRRNELDSEVLPLAWPWGPLATCKHTLKFLEGRYQTISLTVAGLDGAPGRLGSRRFSGIKIIMNLEEDALPCTLLLKKPNPNLYGIFIVYKTIQPEGICSNGFLLSNRPYETANVHNESPIINII